MGVGITGRSAFLRRFCLSPSAHFAPLSAKKGACWIDQDRTLTTIVDQCTLCAMMDDDEDDPSYMVRHDGDGSGEEDNPFQDVCDDEEQ